MQKIKIIEYALERDYSYLTILFQKSNNSFLLKIRIFLVTQELMLKGHRAIIKNIKILPKQKLGASTTTQQVAKNFLLSNEVSMKRKLRKLF